MAAKNMNPVLLQGTFAGLKVLPKSTKRKKVTYYVTIEKSVLTYTTSKKRKPEKTVQVPLQLIWLQERNVNLLRKEEDTEIQRVLCFELILPNERVLMSATTLEVKKLWVTELKKHIVRRMKELKLDPEAEHRTGKFTFDVGTYEGGWLHAQPHGDGTFVDTAGTLYKGYWHSVMKAGYGRISKSGTGNSSNDINAVGWEYDIPFTGVAKELLDDAQANGVEGPTQQDLDSLLGSKGVQLVEYKKGEVIVHENAANTFIYRIKTGQVECKKAHVTKSELLSSPVMFGEMAIFEKKIIYSTYIAISDVELYKMDVNSLYSSVFLSHPNLAKRFHLQLAKSLAMKLSNITADGEVDPPSSTLPSGNTSTNNSTNRSKDKESKSNTSNDDDDVTDDGEDEDIVTKLKAKPRKGSDGKSDFNDDDGCNSENTDTEAASESETSNASTAQDLPLFSLPNNKLLPPIIRSSQSNSRTSIDAADLSDDEEAPSKNSEILSKFPAVERGPLSDEFWSHDWSSMLDYCKSDVVYRDPFSIENVTGKEALKSHKEAVHATYATWKWRVEESVLTTPAPLTTSSTAASTTTTTIMRCSLAIMRADGRVFIEHAVVWLTAENEQQPEKKSQQIQKILIFFDASKVRHELRRDLSRGKATKKKNSISSNSSANPANTLVLVKAVKHGRRKSDPRPSRSLELAGSAASSVDDGDDYDNEKSDKKQRREKSDSSPRKSEKGKSGKSGKSDVSSPRNSTPSTTTTTTTTTTSTITGQTAGAKKDEKKKEQTDDKKKEIPKKRATLVESDAPEYISTDDMKKFAEEFQLPDGEPVSFVQEFRCQLDFGNKLPILGRTRKTGICYIMTKYLCYYKIENGVTIKEVLPTKFIERASVKENTNTITIKLDKKGAVRAKARITATTATCILSFNTYIECNEAMRIIDKLLEHNEKSDGSPRRRDKENVMQTAVQTSTLDNEVPTVEFIPSRSTPSIRLTGPRKDFRAAVISDEVCGTCISTYPRVATIGKDGNVVLSDERQGDPICDQFCLERYQNRTLFAVADGCNWGKKPQTAAKIAAQTFVDFNKRTIFDNDMKNTNNMMRSFLTSFLQAHTKITEGHEEKWWECGTTTLLGGCITEVNEPNHKWAFLCLSVGDCKVYHLSVKDETKLEIEDITKNSRTGEGALDARDCGGRLGPYKHGNPDLRNLSAFFHYVNEGDFIICCSDGIYDNLDPQSLGIDPSDLGLGDIGLTWEEIETKGEELLKKIEEKKLKFSIERLHTIINELLAEQKISLRDLNVNDLSTKIIDYCVKMTEKTRVYMESHPNNLQPRDYKEYPGKVDHSTCLVIRVCRSNFRQKEADMENLVVRLRHPTYGINKEAEGVQQGTFKGQELIKWLHHDPQYGEDEMDVAQGLMNFNFIAPVTAFDSYTLETFDPMKLYQFKSHEPILTRRDWEIILQGTQRKTYHKGDIIIKEGTPQVQIYQLTYGICRIEKTAKSHRKVLRKTTEKVERRSNPPPGPHLRQNSDPATTVTAREKSGSIGKSTTNTNTIINSSGGLNSSGSVPNTNSTGSIGNSSGLGNSNSVGNSSGLGNSSGEVGDASVVQLGTIGAPQTFGEVSMLIDGKSSASVIADTDEVEVIILDKNFINIMFVRYPDMAGRFYHYLASVLARRLAFHEAASSSSNSSNSSNSSINNSSNSNNINNNSSNNSNSSNTSNNTDTKHNSVNS